MVNALKSDVTAWGARIGLAVLSLATFVTGGSANTATPFGARATNADRNISRSPDQRATGAWQLADDDSNSSGGHSNGPSGTIGVRG